MVELLGRIEQATYFDKVMQIRNKYDKDVFRFATAVCAGGWPPGAHEEGTALWQRFNSAKVYPSRSGPDFG